MFCRQQGQQIELGAAVVATPVSCALQEKMVRLFKVDHSGTDKLLARRNWCEVWLAQGAAKPRNNTHLKEFAEGVQPGDLVFSLRVEASF